MVSNIYGKKLLSVFVLFFALSAYTQQVSISSGGVTQFTAPATVALDAVVTDLTLPDPAYLLVENTMTGYRKLKLGYSPISVYSPTQNVISGGNTHLQITMRVNNPNLAWGKIQIRPMGLGTLSLLPYVQAAGAISDQWFTITIPLSDFSSSVDFTQIANIEFPYSAGAPFFQISIASMKFIGGSTPFVWFGEGKTDNKHNGNGGPGELIANLVPEIITGAVPVKMSFMHEDNLIAEDFYSPYQCSWSIPEAGSYNAKAVLYMSDNTTIESDILQLEVVVPPPPPFAVSLDFTQGSATQTAPASIQLTATVTGLTPPPPDYMLVTNSFSGFRKLKFGYSPLSIYSPLNDVTVGGNTHMEIVLRDAGGGADWAKIQVRPAGIGTLSLLNYVYAAGGVGQDWKTILIPLSDFNSNVNFSAIANLEFPYSANAPWFQIAIKSIRFIGGTTPFTWFGDGKTDNKHNGNGGSGELVANVFLGQLSGNFIEKVQFFSGDQMIGEDSETPYELSADGLTAGTYSYTAKVISHSGETTTSEPLALVVSDPAVAVSTMSVAIANPLPGTQWLAPLNLPVECIASGAIQSAPDYLHVINTLTGFRKLRFGYSPTSYTSPKQNVTAGGNDTLEIVLKNLGGTLNWSKIRIKPEGIGILDLGQYAAAVGGIGNEWKTIKIPLAHFDSTVNWSAIGFFEFPYSAGANSFQIGIQSMRFTGGTTPFLWFGEGKTDNIHDGDGSSGKMTASVISPSALAVDVAKVFLFDNGQLVATDSVSPWAPILPNPQPGIHNLVARLLDSKGAITYSAPVSIQVIPTLPEGHLLVTMTFDQNPSSITFKKAKLRYNKDFAYSVSFDDGLADAYTCAFKLMSGGYSSVTQQSYPGLFYTDGCGNSIPFKGSLMWNSVSSSFSDIHINTPGYVSWVQLNEMLDNGWGVVNHSYSHSTDPLVTNFLYQITANDSAVFNRTGIRMNHFVAPGGNNSVGYYPLAWETGIKCAYSRSASFGNPNGANVTNPLNYNQPLIYRDYKIDDTHNTANILNGINACANQSGNGNHFWYNDFTHHVHPQHYGGSLLFSLFKFYLDSVAAMYGENGSDRIWAASGVEVFEYLKLRDSSNVTWSWFGNQLRIMIDRTNIPDSLIRYAMSFLVDADANVTSVTCNDPAVLMTWRCNTPEKLLNIEWKLPYYPLPPSNQGAPTAGNKSLKECQSGSICQVGNSNKILLNLPNESSGTGKLTVYDMIGQVMYEEQVNNLTLSKVLTDIPRLPVGVYLVRFRDACGKTVTGRFCQPQ